MGHFSDTPETKGTYMIHDQLNLKFVKRKTREILIEGGLSLPAPGQKNPIVTSHGKREHKCCHLLPQRLFRATAYNNSKACLKVPFESN